MKTQDRKRTIAAILVALSVVMLFLPWMTLYGEAAKELRETIKKAKEYGYSIQDAVEYVIGPMSYYVPEKLQKQVGTAAKAMSDGRLSASETVSVTRVFSALFHRLKDYSDDYTKYWICLAAYPWLFWATLAMGVLTVILYFTKDGKNSAGAIYAALQVLLFAYFLVMVISLSSGEDNYFGDSLSVRITLFSILSAGFALFANPIAGLIEKRIPVTAVGPAVSAVTASGWTCACGSVNAEDKAFCGQCGKPKPEPCVCPQCGQQVAPGTAFCGKCGAKIEAGEAKETEEDDAMRTEG